MTRVLIISGEPIGTRMAGPAIRDWEYARVLSQTCQVTIAAPDASGLQPNGFTLKSYQSHKSLAALVAQADVVITSGYTVRHHPFRGLTAVCGRRDVCSPGDAPRVRDHVKRVAPGR